MGVLQWSIRHKAANHLVKSLLKDFGFSPCDASGSLSGGMYLIRVPAATVLLDMKVGVKSGDLTFFLYQEEETTSESYFDYLVQCGFLIGAIATRVEDFPEASDAERMSDEAWDVGIAKEDAAIAGPELVPDVGFSDLTEGAED